jgi:hypothetical protein
MGDYFRGACITAVTSFGPVTLLDKLYKLQLFFQFNYFQSTNKKCYSIASAVFDLNNTGSSEEHKISCSFSLMQLVCDVPRKENSI